GGSGSNDPTNVIFANNIFTNPDDGLFEDPTNNETWIGNIAFGTLGINLPASGITVVDPMLVQNSAGFYGLDSLSPAIDAAQPGYLALPQFAGMDTIDTELLFDMMGQNRPDSIEMRDLGANEYPHNILIQPLATEANTGPTYETSFLSSLDQTQLIVEDLFQLFPNPVQDQLNLELEASAPSEIKIEILDIHGRIIDTIFYDTIGQGPFLLSQQLDTLAAGSYLLRVRSQALSGGQIKMQSRSFIKL
ncbi:MAG: T9SS type A sorting domain-containing protein, partial [Bacteroidota bacterium]